MWPFRRKAATPFAERKSASYFFTLGGLRAGLTGAGYDKLATEGYGECVVAFACINIIAAAAASVEPQLYRQKNGKLTKVEDSELLALLENPNPAQSGRDFRQSLVSYYKLSGNAYIFGNAMDSRPTELQLLNPGKVKIEPGQGGIPSFYEVKDGSNTRRFPVDRVTGKSPILHLKTFNPLNPWYGMSPLQAAALGVDIHTGGQEWNNRLIDNGARPSGALVVSAKDGQPATLSEDQYTRIKQMIDEQFSGSANAGRPMLLEGGLDWKEMSINPKDMEFLEGKHSAARDIALAFGVPPMLLGIPGDNTYSNMQEAKQALWTDTVLPLVCVVNDALNRWLTPLYGEDLYLWYDEEMIPVLEPLRKAKADRINAATYLTLDEKRAAMGYPAYAPTGTPGGTILVPSTSVPLELAGDVNLPEPGSAADPNGPA
jgi:HK97 family phage portal protein